MRTDIYSKLALDLEGKLFVNFSVSNFMGDTYWVNKDYYTVKNGLVLMVNNNV